MTLRFTSASEDVVVEKVELYIMWKKKQPTKDPTTRDKQNTTEVLQDNKSLSRVPVDINT